MTTGKISPWQIAVILSGSLLLSILFFSPRLWLMQDIVPGSNQWSRGLTYLQQCADPFRQDVEPAMQWRLLPPWLAHALHLPGKSPLVLPWLGVAALLGYVAVLHARRLSDIRYVLGGTILVGTTSAVLVPVGWLGINDAWVWLGLLAVAFGRSRWCGPVACLLCPWIDERFIIGLPLAWFVRCMDRNEPVFCRRTLVAGWLLPYVVCRLAFGGNPMGNNGSSRFLATQLPTVFVLLPLAPLGWWMGLRVGWFGLAYAFNDLTPRHRWGAAILGGATLVLMLLLASDISRSAAILLPAVLLGGFILARRLPDRAPRILLVAGVANLLIPAAHVVLTRIDPIHPLPVELIRLLRTP